MKRSISLTGIFLFALCLEASAQNLGIDMGYTHISGDGGLDGFHLGAAPWFSERVALAFDFDSGWDTSHIGAFALTDVGTVITKANIQDYLFGPRVFFPMLQSKKINLPRLWPFAEAEFGISHLSSSIKQPTTGTSLSVSDNAFTWLLGGGVDYLASPHWAGRVKVDFVRTHFSDMGQSRVRLILGLTYSFKGRRTSRQ